MPTLADIKVKYENKTFEQAFLQNPNSAVRAALAEESNWKQVAPKAVTVKICAVPVIGTSDNLQENAANIGNATHDQMLLKWMNNPAPNPFCFDYDTPMYNGGVNARLKGQYNDPSNVFSQFERLFGVKFFMNLPYNCTVRINGDDLFKHCIWPSTKEQVTANNLKDKMKKKVYTFGNTKVVVYELPWTNVIFEDDNDYVAMLIPNKSFSRISFPGTYMGSYVMLNPMNYTPRFKSLQCPYDYLILKKDKTLPTHRLPAMNPYIFSAMFDMRSAEGEFKSMDFTFDDTDLLTRGNKVKFNKEDYNKAAATAQKTAESTGTEMITVADAFEKFKKVYSKAADCSFTVKRSFDKMMIPDLMDRFNNRASAYIKGTDPKLIDDIMTAEAKNFKSNTDIKSTILNITINDTVQVSIPLKTRLDYALAFIGLCRSYKKTANCKITEHKAQNEGQYLSFWSSLYNN